MLKIIFGGRHIHGEEHNVAMASWLLCSTTDRVVRVQALAGDFVLCFWARHLTLKMPISNQVLNWGLANLMLVGTFC